MHLIMTHENADFDAIASLLAAALLYPEATAVVPHISNQNVGDFLTLYWGELPFIEHRDLLEGPIDQITLVDTQYLPPRKGRSKQTKIRIIDHHAPSENRPPEAETILFETGANVTYLVEEIVRVNSQVKPIHATLMLLGIHEDCGSLTYGNTTPRDAKAAAWLMEQGAYLDIVRDFLRYGLTPAQRKLYNTITNHIEAQTINGQQIIISAVEIDERVPEISSIAHQLRDLYNPDGLFLLVYMNDEGAYIQLIARSTTDAIHVGDIARALGGAGHARAAAAHIEDQTLDQTYKRLMAVLKKNIQPARTVRQIMSFRVQTLAPHQTIREAAGMATRYGHEGYPVAQGNKVVGILTRREIDKAMHHQLGGAAVRQFMHQGEISVSPEDTVETVQKIMLERRVGQIPVVEAGKITGIVTRTDLITLWGKERQPSTQYLNLADRLRAALPDPLLALLQDAGREAAQIGSSLYIVGGVVRDLLLQKPISDIDLVVEGDAINLGRAMRDKYGGHLHTHKRFGTANWITEGTVSGVERLDFVTARTEFYHHPSALPEVEPSSIKQDLHRRDFTINTLALALAPDRFGDVLDFYGGYKDIQEGVIRVLHSLSFVEDPTRILRAIRLEQRLNFRISQRTLEHLNNALDMLSRVTSKRIFTEFEHIFAEKEPEKAIGRLNELGVLSAIQPDLTVTNWFASRCEQLRTSLDHTPWSEIEPEVVHYFGLLTFNLEPESVESFIQRLRLPSDLARPLTQIQAIKGAAAGLKQAHTPSQIHARLSRYTEDAIMVCWLAFDAALLRERLIQYSRHLRHIKPLINGNYLIDHFNLRPSPLFQEILTMLRDARLDGRATNLAEEHQLVEDFLRNEH